MPLVVSALTFGAAQAQADDPVPTGDGLSCRGPLPEPFASTPLLEWLGCLMGTVGANYPKDLKAVIE